MASEQTLGTIVMQMIDELERMKADGVPDVTRRAALEGLLRERWPFTRAWKYLCQYCDDTGLLIERRPERLYGGQMVDVGAPCTCSKGARFRTKSKAEADFTQAGKVAGKFTRFGR